VLVSSAGKVMDKSQEEIEKEIERRRHFKESYNTGRLMFKKNCKLDNTWVH